MSNKAENLPTCLAGEISHADPSFCLDGADFKICTPFLGCFRVKPASKEQRTALEGLIDSGDPTYVCGHPRGEGSCAHIVAVVVLPAPKFPAEAISAMGGFYVGNG